MPIVMTCRPDVRPASPTVVWVAPWAVNRDT